MVVIQGENAMGDSASGKIYLRDYKPFGFLIDKVDLVFTLSPNATRVKSRISFFPNPAADDSGFFLHGENLKLVSAKIDCIDVQVNVSEKGLTCDVPDGPFVWEAEVEINPAENTALEGLYMSNGMYCTQCEAEGFRKITYYPDRPDVMAPFSVRIEGGEKTMLSNGNPGTAGNGFVEWNDPWPKPAYLFALVAGDLVNHPGTYTTKSGRNVDLNIWVRHGDEGKCAFAMESLVKSMQWDEDVYGREYDLDVFNIVAVDDFNMGAMENKGLNVFNSSCVLASPETSTDENFERIEAIIAHEYFHNWTGNRITCRDWFQLSLKEGLTVFRDSQFTGDVRSGPVKRVSDAITLRSIQFREDSGPLAHPVRPESFIEINNFYTATVYIKGAELVGMLKTLVGCENYHKALDLYFNRHDGRAATIEDWLKVFEDTTGRDLSQFKLWYSQAGTPRLKVTDEHVDNTYILTFEQNTPPTPGQDVKEPMVVPIAVGLMDTNGEEIMETRVLEMTEARQSFSFQDVRERPVPSILREFSAPVIVERETTDEERLLLLAHDTDPFSKWEAGRSLAEKNLAAMIVDRAPPEAGFLNAMHSMACDDSLDPAFRALALKLPTQDGMSQILHDRGITPDPQAIWAALETLHHAMAERMRDIAPRLYEKHQVSLPYKPDTEQSGARALANAVLTLITRMDGGKLAKSQYEGADNMTQQLAAFACLLQTDCAMPYAKRFYDQWSCDRLVIDKWFAYQVLHSPPDQATAVAKRLTDHPDFNMKNPNRFRAVLGSLSMNTAGFHVASGSGYRLYADWLLKLDPLNPQTAARMCSAFSTWKRHDDKRQSQIREQLKRIQDVPTLSVDMREMTDRILNA